MENSECRLISLNEAAHYCGVSSSGYRAAVYKGRFPGPLPGGRKIDKRALDAALDRLSGMITAPEEKLSPYDEWKKVEQANRYREGC